MMQIQLCVIHLKHSCADPPRGTGTLIHLLFLHLILTSYLSIQHDKEYVAQLILYLSSSVLSPTACRAGVFKAALYMTFMLW